MNTIVEELQSTTEYWTGKILFDENRSIADEQPLASAGRWNKTTKAFVSWLFTWLLHDFQDGAKGEKLAVVPLGMFGL